MTMFKVARLARSNNQVLRAFDQRWARESRNDQRNHPVPDIINELMVMLLCAVGFICGILFVIIFTKLRNDPTNLTLILLGSIMAGVITFASLRSRSIWQRIRDSKGAHEFMAIISLMESIYKKGKLTDNMWEWDQWNAADSGKAVFSYLRSRAKKLQQLEMISWRKSEEEYLRNQFEWELDRLSRIALIPSARERYFVDEEEVKEESRPTVDLSQYRSVATSK